VSKPITLAACALFVFVVAVSGVLRAQSPLWPSVVMGTEAMIAAEHPLEALAARKALEAGGNAIDAAVATFYMTTVVEHHQAGIGGDGFILAYLADRDEVVFINGTGPAPQLATREKYLELGGIPSAGPFASDVPGAVGGFDLALRTYGTMSYADLLQPAIKAARDGHPLSFWAAGNHARAIDKLSPYPSSRILLKNGGPFEPGDLFVQTDLARSLETIAREGTKSFYKGTIARRIDEFYREQGGLIRYDDLASYEAEEAAPIQTLYRGLDVYQSAPNSQGIVLLLALNILEGFDLAAMGHNSADYVHVVTEALKLAFADRNRYIADPRFVDMPVDALLSQDYGDVRRSLIQLDRAIAGVAPPGDPVGGSSVLSGHEIAYETPSSSGQQARAPVAFDDGGETSSFSIADRFGNLVSVTHSVNGGFGSGMVVDGLGFVLNNRMPYFSLEEEAVNVLVPGKRTRHTINPALAMKDGKPFLAWNTPGGDNQPQAMLQAFLAIVEFGMNVQQAVEAPTVTSSSFAGSNYPQRARNQLALPQVLADHVGDDLAARGHALQIGELQQPYRQAISGAGAVKMVMIDPETGVMFGGVSPAKDDYVVGW
jgi:gamma-glutamyltranspeptidase/glutathione hydrolase